MSFTEELISRGKTCNDCYYSMQNCKNSAICCEFEEGLCDEFEEGCHCCYGIESRLLRFEYYWIDEDGNTASFQDREHHIVATGTAKYCPNCGRRLDYSEVSNE